jgi:hypothetical protein
MNLVDMKHYFIGTDYLHLQVYFSLPPPSFVSLTFLPIPCLFPRKYFFPKARPGRNYPLNKLRLFSSLSATSYALTMETAASYKMSMPIYEPTRRHIQEGHNLNIHCHGNLSSRKRIPLVCVSKGEAHFPKENSKAIYLLTSDNANSFLGGFLGWG